MDRRSFLAMGALALALASAPALASGMQSYQAAKFEEALKAGPVVVHVHASWCPVCRKQQPAIQALSNEPGMDKVTFITVNFDKDREFLRTNKVANQSVIVVFKDGKEVSRIAGITDQAAIHQRIKAAL